MMFVKMVSNVFYMGQAYASGKTYKVDSVFVEHCKGCFIEVKEIDAPGEIKDIPEKKDKMMRKGKTK